MNIDKIFSFGNPDEIRISEHLREKQLQCQLRKCGISYSPSDYRPFGMRAKTDKKHT
jgi:hypothetical protein